MVKIQSLIRKCVARGLLVMWMLKNTPKIYYSFGGKPLSFLSFHQNSEKITGQYYWIVCREPQSHRENTFRSDGLGPK